MSAASAASSLARGCEVEEGALPRAALTRRVGSDLPLRVASAVALAPLAIGAAYVGGAVFSAFWLLAALGVLWEWNTLGAHDARASTAQAVTVAGAAGLAASALAFGLGWPRSALAALGLGALAAACFAPGKSRIWAVGGVLYAGNIALGPAALRADAQLGLSAIVILFALVWATDVAAYFGGRLLGGPRLWPRVSPKKTWSGAIVGTVSAIAAALGLARWSGLGNLAGLAVLFLVLSVASQAGDLWESALKRRFGAKDSGQIIPGHGGLMDRLDGFAAATAAAVFIGLARGGPDAASRGLLIW